MKLIVHESNHLSAVVTQYGSTDGHVENDDVKKNEVVDNVAQKVFKQQNQEQVTIYMIMRAPFQSHKGYQTYNSSKGIPLEESGIASCGAVKFEKQTVDKDLAERLFKCQMAFYAN